MHQQRIEGPARGTAPARMAAKQPISAAVSLPVEPFGVLISAPELAQLLTAKASGPALLDVRWELAAGPQRGEYERAHIPGAAFVNLDTDLAGAPGKHGRHPLPDQAVWSEAMRAAGVSSGRPVVVYDASTSMAAARAWWLLRYFGHDDVRVLDGGLRAWIDAGYETEAGIPQIDRGEFEPKPGGMPLLDAPAAAHTAATGTLIDARAPERFRGEHEPIDPIAGHIPGAVNRPASENVDERGRFKDTAALRAALGDELTAPLGAYCGSGVTAAHEVLALHLAGYEAALYPGSWSEWITDPSRPVARGSA